MLSQRDTIKEQGNLILAETPPAQKYQISGG
jgi:hypothetical protein